MDCLQIQTIPRGAIKLHMPKGIQTNGYSCGANAFRGICRYYKVGPKPEAEYIKLLKSTYTNGTRYQEFTRVANEFGLNAKVSIGMTFNKLVDYLDNAIPVICAIQAWGTGKAYANLNSGHYVVAIGHKNDIFYFEDPSIEPGYRGWLPKKEFKERWCDRDTEKDCERLGIAVWKDGGKKSIRRIKLAKKIL